MIYRRIGRDGRDQQPVGVCHPDAVSAAHRLLLRSPPSEDSPSESASEETKSSVHTMLNPISHGDCSTIALQVCILDFMISSRKIGDFCTVQGPFRPIRIVLGARFGWVTTFVERSQGQNVGSIEHVWD